MDSVERVLQTFIEGLFTLRHNSDIARLGKHCLDDIGEAPAGTQKADWDTLGWRAENTRYLVKNFQIATGLIMSLKPKDRRRPWGSRLVFCLFTKPQLLISKRHDRIYSVSDAPLICIAASVDLSQIIVRFFCVSR